MYFFKAILFIHVIIFIKCSQATSLSRLPFDIQCKLRELTCYTLRSSTSLTPLANFFGCYRTNFVEIIEDDGMCYPSVMDAPVCMPDLWCSHDRNEEDSHDKHENAAKEVLHIQSLPLDNVTKQMLLKVRSGYPGAFQAIRGMNLSACLFNQTERSDISAALSKHEGDFAILLKLLSCYNSTMNSTAGRSRILQTIFPQSFLFYGRKYLLYIYFLVLLPFTFVVSMALCKRHLVPHHNVTSTLRLKARHPTSSQTQVTTQDFISQLPREGPTGQNVIYAKWHSKYSSNVAKDPSSSENRAVQRLEHTEATNTQPRRNRPTTRAIAAEGPRSKPVLIGSTSHRNGSADASKENKKGRMTSAKTPPQQIRRRGTANDTDTTASPEGMVLRSGLTPKRYKKPITPSRRKGGAS